LHTSGKPDVVAGAGLAWPQEMHDNHQHTVLDVSDYVFLRRKRGDHVRVLDNDGSERGILGWSVFRVHRRGLRTEAQRCPDVCHECVLLQRIAAVRRHLRHHQTVEVDRIHQHGDTDHNYCDFVHGG